MIEELITDIASTSDIDQLVRLEESNFEEYRLSPRNFRHLIKAPTALVAVTKQADKVIAGAIMLFRKNSTKARLYSISVDPNFQQRGVAHLLCQFLEKNSLKHHCTEIRLEVKQNNMRAINFYRKNGYEVFAKYKSYYKDGQDALRMQKTLISAMPEKRN